MNKLTQYFAYGSNLHPARLEKRIGRCARGTLVYLHGARLTFNKRGIEGSGKCNIDFTHSKTDTVIGVLYEVSTTQRKLLDDWEAATCGYEALNTLVTTQTQTVDAFTYKAGDEFIDNALLPFHWYKRFVILGAAYFGFPQDYLYQLEQQQSIPDNDPDRARQNAILLAELEQANHDLIQNGKQGQI